MRQCIPGGRVAADQQSVRSPQQDGGGEQRSEQPRSNPNGWERSINAPTAPTIVHITVWLQRRAALFADRIVFTAWVPGITAQERAPAATTRRQTTSHRWAAPEAALEALSTAERGVRA
jgi:hypothetical protein